MPVTASMAREVVAQASRVFLACFTIAAAFSVLTFMYLGARYGWAHLFDALAPDDVRKWVKGLLFVTSLCVVAHWVGRLMDGIFARLSRLYKE